MQPTCEGNCKKVYPCGHKCPLKCHLGNCPPCLEPIKKTCRCGKEEFLNSNCSSIAPNCGQLCGFPMKCGHICQKVCHVKG
jgi:transcriptional repressor NF-X1